jgi:hypothetical protein
MLAMPKTWNPDGIRIIRVFNSASLILRILKALCLDVVIPGIFRAPTKVIVIDGKLATGVIHDGKR